MDAKQITINDFLIIVKNSNNKTNSSSEAF